MKTAAFQTSLRKTDLGTSPRKSGSILPWVSSRFRQLILARPLRPANTLSGKRTAPATARPALYPARWRPLLPPASRWYSPPSRATVRFLTNSAREKGGHKGTMKTRRRQGTTKDDSRRSCNHRGNSPPRSGDLHGTRWHPGNELDDWLRAELELKRERTGTNTDTT